MKPIRIATEAIECTLHNALVHTCWHVLHTHRNTKARTKAELSSKATEKRIKRNSDDLRLMSKDLLVDRWSCRNELEWKMYVELWCVCMCVVDCRWTQKIETNGFSIEFAANASQTIWFRLLPHTIFIHRNTVVLSSAVWWVYWIRIYMRFIGSQCEEKKRIVISFKIGTHRKKKESRIEA